MKKLIGFAMCGSVDAEYDPYRATHDLITQRILLSINRNPMRIDEIASDLGIKRPLIEKSLATLTKLRLVKEFVSEGEKHYFPAFAIFTLEDKELLSPLVQMLAEGIENVVKERLGDVARKFDLCSFREQGFAFEDLAYIIVVAYTLDYEALSILEDLDLLIVSKEMPRGKYVFTGFEGEGLLGRKWMWGHRDIFCNSLLFSTHGELPLRGCRKAFPDLAWRWKVRGTRDVERRTCDIARILLELCKKPSTLQEAALSTEIERAKIRGYLQLLLRLGYVKLIGNTYNISCPVVRKEDKVRIKESAHETIIQVAKSVFKPRWHMIRRIYSKTRPAKNGVDIKEAFNPIYHLSFEEAAKRLMDEGAIKSPPVRPDGAHYAYWVEELH